MSQGYLSIVLHAHLPFVRHPEHAEFLEERWLFEAITETYIPLIMRLDRLKAENIPCRLALSLSPPLISMLADPLLIDRYQEYLRKSLELAEKEAIRTQWSEEMAPVSVFYRHRLKEIYRRYEDVYHRDLLAQFRRLQAEGVLELFTSCATHGYLPLMQAQPEAARAQIRVGMDTFRHFMGTEPAGLWLPECGYHPDHDRLLAEEGVRYVIVDAHAVLFGNKRPRAGVYAPVQTPGGLAAFGRDLVSSRNVWSSTEGYPGSAEYREFYRDIGFELDIDYLKPYINADGSRVSTGFKYHRVTGQTNDKAIYDPKAAYEKAFADAQDFVSKRLKQVKSLTPLLDRPPLVVTPFDAELFGHWWFEGPDWLEMVFRAAHDSKGLEMITPGDYLSRFEDNQPMQLSLSSWGANGYHEVWLNGSNDWVLREVREIAEKMKRYAQSVENPETEQVRVLNQMARELLLAQSSDWAFILKTQTHTAYAFRRIRDHIDRFNRLESFLLSAQIDEKWLSDIESRDNIFPMIDYQIYAYDRDRHLESVA